MESTELVREVLECFGYHATTVHNAEGGQVNRTWRAETERGPVAVRRYHPMRRTAAVAWEHELLEFAASQGWPVARALPTPEGITVVEYEGALWSVFRWLDGAPATEEHPGIAHIAGRLLARLHRDLERFPGEGQRPGTGKIWELDIVAEAAGSASFNTLLAEFGEQHADLATGIRRQRYRNLRELSALHYPDLPDRVVHGDFGFENLLFADGQVSGVLDFDWCRRDALATDIATWIAPFSQRDIAVTRSFLEGYQEARPLDDIEWLLLPALMRAQLVHFCAFRLVEWKLLGWERAVASIGRTVGERFGLVDALGAALNREIRSR